MSKLGFITNQDQCHKSQSTPIIDESFTNALCFGKTGAGKTAGFILPNIEERLKNNHGLLIYDYKGNLHLQVKALAKKYSRLSDIYELGKPWGIKTNILEDYNYRQLSLIYDQLHGGSRDPYWRNASRNLFLSIYKLMEIQNKLEKMLNEDFPEVINNRFNSKMKNRFYLSFETIMTNVSSVVNLKKFLIYIANRNRRYKSAIPFIIKHEQSYKKLSLFIKLTEEIDQTLNNLDGYTKLKDQEEEHGKYAVISSLNTVLSEIAENEYINHKNSFNIAKELRAGKIVIINVDSFSEDLLNLLNNAIYNRLQFLKIENEHPVTIFIDEAQKVLHKDSLPDVDVCRENKFEYILATQDKILLAAKLGDKNTVMLTRNIVSQYSFASTDRSSNTSDLDTFEYRDLMSNVKSHTKPIFMDKDELYSIELFYQDSLNIFDNVETNYSTTYILKYDALLYMNNEIDIVHADGYIETSPYYEDYQMIIDKHKPRDIKTSALISRRKKAPTADEVFGREMKSKNDEIF